VSDPGPTSASSRPCRHGPAGPGHLRKHSAAIGGPDEPGHDDERHLRHDDKRHLRRDDEGHARHADAGHLGRDDEGRLRRDDEKHLRHDTKNLDRAQ
jgi:hypothetical protein